MKILLVSLSNVGDALLTLPVLARLRRQYPEAVADVIVGPRASGVFDGDPRVHRVWVFDKRGGARAKLRMLGQVRRERYDLTVDLRRSLFGVLSGARRSTSVWRQPSSRIRHMRERHLWMAETALGASDARTLGVGPMDDFWIGEEDRRAADQLLAVTGGVAGATRLVALAPGARSHLKRWTESGFADLIEGLWGDGIACVMVGDESDREIAERIRQRCGAADPLNLCGRTALRQLGALLTRCRLLISNDSAPVHLAGLLGVPVLAIFGPTDPQRYGPSGSSDRVARVDLFCSPCERALCPYEHECMQWLRAGQVLTAAREMLGVAERRSGASGGGMGSGGQSSAVVDYCGTVTVSRKFLAIG